MVEPIELRDAEEIQKAHDILHMILEGETPFTVDAALAYKMIIGAEVLCWCLKHQHDNPFADFLAAVEKRFNELGFVLEPIPEETLAEIQRIQRMAE
jgi:hypothetical protein